MVWMDGNLYIKTSKSAQTAPGVHLKEGALVAFIDNGSGCIEHIRVLSEPVRILQNVRVKIGIALGLIKPKKLLPMA